MKTAELFHKYAQQWEIRPDGSDLTKSIVIEDFDLALTDYKQSIIGIIDEMIEKIDKMGWGKPKEGDEYDDFIATIERQVLSELKQKIEEL